MRHQNNAIDPVERDRLQALAALDPDGVADLVPDPDLDALVRTAALVCGTPISLVSLVGADHQWFKANYGLEPVSQTTRDVSFCAHAIIGADVMVVRDATLDDRFCDNALVTGAPDIRFYAGAPLKLSDGHQVGALCVIDRVPRELTALQISILADLAKVAVHLLENKRAARDAHLVAAELHRLHELVPLGIYSTDPTGLCTNVNRQWQEIYALGFDQALGHGWVAAIHPDDADRVALRWSEAIDRAGRFEDEFRIRRPDASVRIIRSVARALVGDQGHVAGYVGWAEDVTIRRQNEARLAAKRSKLDLILRATCSAAVEWNVQTDETKVDETWARLTGNRLSDFVEVNGALWREQVHPDDRATLAQAQNDHFLDPSEPFNVVVRKKHVDGRWVSLLVRGNVVSRTPDGEPEWVYSVMVDVTERVRLEEIGRQNAQLLEKTGDVAGVGGWDLDLRSSVLRWTVQTCRIHGVPDDFQPDVAKAIGYYAPKSQPVIQTALETAITTGMGWDLELQLIRADGQLIWVRAVGSVEFDGIEPVRLYGAFQDISDRIMQQQTLRVEHRRLLLATESGSIGTWEFSIDTQHLIWDRQMFKMFGYPEGTSEHPFAIWQKTVFPDDEARMNDLLGDCLRSGARYDADFRITWPNGKVRYLRTLADIAVDPISGAQTLIGVNWDVTELRLLNMELADQHEMMRVTLKSIGDAVITTDAEGRVTWLNPIAEKMTGWPVDEALGQRLRQVFHIVHEKTREPVESPVDAALAMRRIVGLAAGSVLISRAGREYGIEDSAAPIRDEAGLIHGVVLVFHDVTEERRLSGEMTYRATHDPLTGAANRAQFESRLDALLTRSASETGSHCLLYVDLDHFKLVNDSCGHSAGDEVLRQVTRHLHECCRSSDLVARIGGDEFALVLEFCSIETGMDIANRICAKMHAYRYVHGDRRFQIGASIGVVPLDRAWRSVEDVVQAADACCLAAKSAGRNRAHLWQEADHAAAVRQGEVQWASLLDQALEDDRFALAFLPIRPLASDEKGLHGEFLIRLIAPDGTRVLPAAFMIAAERYNFAQRIDLWVLQRSLTALGALMAGGPVDRIYVNLSGKSVGDRAFHARALAQLTAAGSHVCAHLGFEFTETAAITNLSDASHFIDAVHDLGLTVSLDDFGAGTASFGYLHNLKVDCLKIDGQFVQGLIRDPLARATVRCFVDVSKALGIPTVAEFVDTPDLLEAVRALGVDYAQGYLFGKPVDVAALLESRAPSAP